MARMCCYPWNCWQEVEKGISSRTPNSFIFILILHLQTCSVFSLGVTIVMILTIKARGDFVAVFFIDVAKYTGKIAAFRRKGCRIFLAWGLNFGLCKEQPNCCITNSYGCTKYEAKLAIPHLLQLTFILMFLMFSNLCLETSIVGN